MMTARLAWAAVQPHSRKAIRESDFALDPFGQLHSDDAQRARWEATSIRESIQHGR